MSSDYVTESGALARIPDDSFYGGDIEPAYAVAYSPKEVQAAHQRNLWRIEDVIAGDPMAVRQSQVDNLLVSPAPVPQDAVLADASEVNAAITDAMIHGKYSSLKKLNTKENEEQIRQLQKLLVDAGYDLGKYGADKNGVDGKIGAKTIAALKKYATAKPRKQYGVSEDPTEEANAVYSIVSNIPGLSYFLPKSYVGTEEQARNLGYKTYVDPESGERCSVGYPVSFDEGYEPTKRDIASAQMRAYGITGDFTADKSAYQKNNYAYLPAYGYNFLAPFSNRANDLPVADPETGMAVRLGANRTETFAERAKDWYNKTFGKNVSYYYGDASPAREDYRNLYFGYPIRNNTLVVNERVDAMNSGEFREGYAFIPKDTKIILDLANGVTNDDGVQYTSGHQLGNFGYGRNENDERWYYDDWDLIGDNADIGFSLIGGKPFQIYDRDVKPEKK